MASSLEQRTPLTLFLDFDGVLTPMPRRVKGAFDWFARLPLFEESVRPLLTELEIIISSDWRHKHSMTDLKKPFSTDFAARIRGVTGAQRDCRESEILEWLYRNPRRSWIAVDDRGDQFHHYFGRLIQIDRETGFSGKDADRLKALFAQMCGDGRELKTAM